ncbi:MAG: hypothetical protein C0506_08180 [Anaerolinea sp.]|nr:hypothetical protein [Anaerolinea sp.]
MPQTIELKISGMTCDHCVRSVTNAVQDVPGVSEAKVSLDTNSAVVKGEAVDIQKILDAIEEEGYEATVR